MRILMVCLGNICRSPLAEGILHTKAEKAGLDWTVDSAGTGAWHVGNLPDRRSIAIGKKYGVDITQQRARQFEQSDFERFDHIFVMDQQNYKNVLRLAQGKTQSEKVQLIRNMVTTGKNLEVPDPYYDDDGFEQVFEMLDQACSKIIETYA